jgi:hypothetical protein
MSDGARLERRYRRLLALYPRRFRRDREQEILSVLMEGAESGQRRPGLAESANLSRHALWMRLLYGTSWERTHHPRVWLGVRLVVGVWLLVVTALLCGQGQWWGLVILAPAALHFYLAYRIARVLEDGG